MSTSTLNSNKLNNQQNQVNIKKIKYKLKKEINPQYNIETDGVIFRERIISSYDFLIHKFGKSIGPSSDGKVKSLWVITVKTSNNFEYLINIYDYEQYETDLKDITNWNIGGIDYEFLDYKKLSKLFRFEYSNYLKQEEKLKKKKEFEQNKSTIKFNNQLNQSEEKYININKFKELDKELDNEKLKEFTDDDLACVLFSRFKESGNFLLKEALIIHRTLEDPENYNKSTIKSLYSNKKKPNNKYCSSTSNPFISIVKSDKTNNNKDKSNKDKSKSNKDKSKYNNK